MFNSLRPTNDFNRSFELLRLPKERNPRFALLTFVAIFLTKQNLYNNCFVKKKDNENLDL